MSIDTDGNVDHIPWGSQRSVNDDHIPWGCQRNVREDEKIHSTLFSDHTGRNFQKDRYTRDDERDKYPLRMRRDRNISLPDRKTQLSDNDYRNVEVYSDGGFWLQNPSVLIQHTDITPHSDMTNVERINAMFRVIIILTIVLYLAGFQIWIVFLLFGILLTLIVWMIVKEPTPPPVSRREYLRPRRIIKPHVAHPRNINRGPTVMIPERTTRIWRTPEYYEKSPSINEFSCRDVPSYSAYRKHDSRNYHRSGDVQYSLPSTARILPRPR